jgi:alkanesulfonate monooxygenase SsuD/methylene tetrahydromethanopterin reductase-like flavin-dependent oxidoreductase (luciferase family)
MEFVAKHRYAYMGIPYFHIDVFDRSFRQFREACEREGYRADPMQAGWLLPIYVAETDEKAREQYEEHFWYFVRRLLPGINVSPPGYTSLRSMENILKGIGYWVANVKTWDEVVEGQYAIIGSPATVLEKLEAGLERLGTGNLLGLFQLGTLPADLTRNSMELFAREVMPRLHGRFGKAEPAAAGRPALAGAKEAV